VSSCPILRARQNVTRSSSTLTSGQIEQLYRSRPPRRRRPGGLAAALGARPLETLRDVIVPGLDLVPTAF
jgi:hypothetical protein